MTDNIPESLAWMRWIEQRHDKQKKERTQREQIQQQISQDTGPSTAQKIMRSIRTNDRRKRLGGNIY